MSDQSGCDSRHVHVGLNSQFAQISLSYFEETISQRQRDNHTQEEVYPEPFLLDFPPEVTNHYRPQRTPPIRRTILFYYRPIQPILWYLRPILHFGPPVQYAPPAPTNRLQRARLVELPRNDSPAVQIGILQRDGSIAGRGQTQTGPPAASAAHVRGSAGHVQGSDGYVQGCAGHVQGSAGHVQGSAGHVQGSAGHVQGSDGNVQRSASNQRRSRTGPAAAGQYQVESGSGGIFQDNSEALRYCGIYPGSSGTHRNCSEALGPSGIGLGSSGTHRGGSGNGFESFGTPWGGSEIGLGSSGAPQGGAGNGLVAIADVQGFVTGTEVNYLKTPYQGKHRVFGFFHCGNCTRQWRSANSWANMGQICFACCEMVYPNKQTSHQYNNLKKPSTATQHIKPKKQHPQEHCEMCQILKQNCRYFSVMPPYFNFRTSTTIEVQ